MATARTRRNLSLRSLALKTTASLALLVLLGVASFLAIGLSTYQGYARQLVPPESVSVNRPSAGARILDRNGNLLYQYIDDQSGVRLPVTLEQVTPAFLAATIATEDSNFFQNPGINPRGL